MTAPGATTCRIMIMAGGTGGHIYPALAIANWLRERKHEVVWLGTRRGLEARIVPAADFPVEWIDVQGLRGKSLTTWVLAPLRLARALFQAWRAFARRKPDVVLGMGGFVTGPGGVMSWLTRRPLVLHEQNALAGLSNRLLAHLTPRVYEAFPGSFRQRVAATAVGNPVRADIAALARPAERFADRQPPVRVLVLGGSLGARTLNTVVPAALAMINADRRPAVRHQTGPRGFDEARTAYDGHGVRAELYPYIEDMADAYGWADLVICRAGALTIAELTVAGIGAVLVPYPYAVDDHQAHNAAVMVQARAAIMVRDHALSAEYLAELLRGELSDREHLLAMAERAHTLGCRDATSTLGQACLDAAAGRGGRA